MKIILEVPRTSRRLATRKGKWVTLHYSNNSTPRNYQHLAASRQKLCIHPLLVHILCQQQQQQHQQQHQQRSWHNHNLDLALHLPDSLWRLHQVVKMVNEGGVAQQPPNPNLDRHLVVGPPTHAPQCLCPKMAWHRAQHSSASCLPALLVRSLVREVAPLSHAHLLGAHRPQRNHLPILSNRSRTNPRRAGKHRPVLLHQLVMNLSKHRQASMQNRAKL